MTLKGAFGGRRDAARIAELESELEQTRTKLEASERNRHETDLQRTKYAGEVGTLTAKLSDAIVALEYCANANTSGLHSVNGTASAALAKLKPPAPKRYPVLETSMLTDLKKGLYTVRTYFNDGTEETRTVPKGVIIVPSGEPL